MSIMEASHQEPPQLGTEIFLGRQPIFDDHSNVYGYELLYRSNGHQNCYTHTDADGATSAVLHRSINVVGMQELVGPHKAFVNFTRKLLINGDWSVVPETRLVIELLETIEPDDEVIAACEAARNAGYLLALDDFIFSPRFEPLLKLADILKIDFLQTPPDERKRIAEQFGNRVHLLAEKVETQGDFLQAKELGYKYFQGYFFCKPTIVSQREIPVMKQHALQFIREINVPEVDFDRLEQIIKRDMALATRLLRYLNSSAVGLSNRITSIRHALTLLGQRPLSKWASLMAMAAFGQDKPSELMTTALVRGRFCERVGLRAGMKERELDLFFMGLFSTMDAMLDQPMDKLTKLLPLPQDVVDALMQSSTQIGTVYSLMLACERGNNNEIDRFNQQLGLPLETVSEIYLEAVTWAEESKRI